MNTNEVNNVSYTCYPFEKASKWWKGYCVENVKTSNEKVISYLQDKRIAVISLIAINLLLFEAAGYFSNLVSKYANSRQDNSGMMPQVGTFFGTLAIGVFMVAKFSPLPLNGLAITAISIATLAARLYMT